VPLSQPLNRPCRRRCRCRVQWQRAVLVATLGASGSPHLRGSNASPLPRLLDLLHRRRSGIVCCKPRMEEGGAAAVLPHRRRRRPSRGSSARATKAGQAEATRRDGLRHPRAGPALATRATGRGEVVVAEVEATEMYLPARGLRATGVSARPRSSRCNWSACLSSRMRSCSRR